jgi:hypothetical protein
MGHWWNTEKTLWLLTPEEFEKIEDGTVLTDIFYCKVIKGTDYIDDDTRFGHLAYDLVKGQKGFPE